MQFSQEAGEVVWNSYVLKNCSQFVVIDAVKGFGIVNKQKYMFFWNSCFFYDPMDVANLISGSSAFSKSILNIQEFSVHILLKPCLKNFEHFLFAFM